MHPFIHKYILTRAPWSNQSTDSAGKLVVSDFNSAFVEQVRQQLGDQVTGVMTDAEIIKLWVDRHNYEKETPRLEVVHGEVSEDGRINVKLEWNDAFIRMLQAAGVEGESEDDMIRVYLMSVTSRIEKEDDDIDESTTIIYDKKSEISKKVPSDTDVEQILDQMDPEVLKMFEKNIRSRAAKRRRNS